MERYRKYAVLRFAPANMRGEVLNIGIVVFGDSGLDLFLAKRLDKLKAMSAGISLSALHDLLQNISKIDAETVGSGPTSAEARAKRISRVGPLLLSDLGEVGSESETAFQRNVNVLLKALVEPEPAPPIMREKRTRLFSEVKKILKREKVLARRHEGLESHRIVSAYEFDEGLVADLVLKNGRYHVIETVDAMSDEHQMRKAIFEVAMSALVLERARMKFGTDEIAGRIVFSASPALERLVQPSLDAAEHQGAELVNWQSADQRNAFINKLATMATPLEDKKRRAFVSSGGGLFH
ncbi:MAG: DUF3037 domain-containing protein [Beijerinckiaceae bacterium]